MAEPARPVRLALRRPGGLPAAPGCCWRPPTASPAATRSGAATPRDWSTWSGRRSSRSTGSPRSATRWSTEIDTHHGGSPGADAALAAITSSADALAADAGLDPMRGPGLVVTLTDAQRDADGRFPRDASPDDLVVHQQDIQAVLNALWSARRRGHPDAGSADHRARRRRGASGTRCCSTAAPTARRTSSPRSATSSAMQAALAAAPLVDALQAVRACGSGSATPRSPRSTVELVGHPDAGADAVRQARRSARLLSAQAQ